MNYSQLIKIKKETYRSEIRKQDINQKMQIKRQKIYEENQQNNFAIEPIFPKFLATFKFMQNYDDPKNIPNKVLLNFGVLT